MPRREDREGRPARFLHRLLAAITAAPLVCLAFSLADENAEQPDKPGELAEYDARITDDDRDYWAFRPVERPAVPSVRNAGWVRNPIDNFVLAKLEEKGWQPAPPAEPHELLRRIHFDLVGLPPSLEAQQAFRENDDPDAYEQTVDRLLADPGHGERWGRHWLDLVRYAETNGYERDAIKPHAWRFRDYVIDSLNDDKPYDRFVIEQIAGDELPDATAETIIATGYHRLGPWDDEPADPSQDRSDQLDDIVRTTSQVFLGLTLGCARCHNHKFDPLTMHDYYRMVAVFDTLQRPQNGRTELDLPAGSRAELARLAARDERIAALQSRMEELRNSFRAEYLAAGRSSLPADVVAAFVADPGKRTAAQQEAVKQHGAALDAALTAAFPPHVAREVTDAQREIERLRRETPDLPRAYFLREPSPEPPQTALLLRGRATSPGPNVLPGIPAVLTREQPPLPRPDQHTSRRRLWFARWIADDRNGLAARVIVNRVWQYHFGEGLVPSSSDFGVMGQYPSHPQLLDWLADWFVHDAGWSLKKLHRLIVTSSTYRMSKSWNDDYGASDPEDRLLWRFPYRRLSVEAIRDAMLAASGQLSRQMHGESVYLAVPKEALEGHSDPELIWKPFDEHRASRRTVYAFIKRSLVVPMLEVLDLCDTTRSSEKRAITSVPTQALTLFNGDEVNRQARHLAERLLREAPGDEAAQIELAYRLTLCRAPTAAETTRLAAYLQTESGRLEQEARAAGGDRPADSIRQEALARLCRVIFNLNEFVYTD